MCLSALRDLTGSQTEFQCQAPPCHSPEGTCWVNDLTSSYDVFQGPADPSAGWKDPPWGTPKSSAYPGRWLRICHSMPARVDAMIPLQHIHFGSQWDQMPMHTHIVPLWMASSLPTTYSTHYSLGYSSVLPSHFTVLNVVIPPKYVLTSAVHESWAYQKKHGRVIILGFPPPRN